MPTQRSTTPTATSQFTAHLVDMMAAWSTVTVRAMFGGHGLYRDGLIFAIVADQTLYLKVDEQTRGRFEAEGCTPFVYRANDRAVATSYWNAPPVCLESTAAMQRWCALAFEAALRAQFAHAAGARARAEQTATIARRRKQVAAWQKAKKRSKKPAKRRANEAAAEPATRPTKRSAPTAGKTADGKMARPIKGAAPKRATKVRAR